MSGRKALYVHDHVFIKDHEGNYYSEGKITDSVFERYEACCSELHVLSRCRYTPSTESYSRITKKNVYFHPVKGLSFSKIFSTNLISTTKKVLYLIKKTELVIIRMPSFLGLFTYLTARAYGRPYFIELVGNPKEAIITSTPKKHFGLVKLFATLMEKSTQSAVLNAPGVIYVTRKNLQEKFPARGFTSSASNVELTIEKPDLSYERYKLPKEAIRIGIIGSFKNNYKGIDTAIASLAKLNEKKIKCHLLILGAGNTVPYLDLANSLGVRSQVFFDGIRQGGKEVYSWLDTLDIYIQPSRTEGLPRSLIEAMSRGIPCVGSNVGGIPELLPERWIISKDSPEELAEKISDLAISHTERYNSGCENFLTSTEYSKERLSQKRAQFWLEAHNHMEGLLKK